MTLYEKKLEKMNRAVGKALRSRNIFTSWYWSIKANRANRDFCKFLENTSIEKASKVKGA